MKRVVKNNIGWVVATALSLVPVLFWVAIMPLANRFSSFMAIFTSLGQIAGLVGMAMFCVTLVLNTRLSVFEDYFGGMNRVYIVHHTLGAVAFSLLLFHPMFLAVRFLVISVVMAAQFLVSSNTIILYGIGAILSMMVFLAFTFFIKLPYQWWRLTHQFLAASFLLACLHVIYISSDISISMPLRYYILTLMGFATAAIVYRVLFHKFFVRRSDYTVKEVNVLNDRVVEIVMSSKNRPILVTPGQFIFVSFYCEDISPEVHPFSLASGANDKDIRIVVKNLGDYTAKLKDLKKGSLASIEGPFGRFSTYYSENKDQIWIAAGIGIVPFIGMAASLAKDDGYHADLYYCLKNESEAVKLKELSEISSQNKNFRVIPYYADEKGFITAEVVSKLSQGVLGKDIFLCGPPPFMKNLRHQLGKLGVKNYNIHSEEFSLN
jgi:predicted ferric reductase